MYHNDPRVAIFNFLKSLPDTIQSTELACLLIYIKDDFDITGKEDESFFLDLVSKLLERSGYAGLGMVLFCKLLINKRMTNAIHDLDKAEKGLKILQDQSPNMYPLLLAKPLQRKHYQIAKENWNALLAGPLSDANIEYHSNNPAMTLKKIQLKNLEE